MHKLVQIETQEEATQEGQVMHHAVGHLFSYIQYKGGLVYSIRLEGASVLTLSVFPESDGTWVCHHVVGADNRKPSEEELAIVEKLLLERGVALRYDPTTIV